MKQHLLIILALLVTLCTFAQDADAPLFEKNISSDSVKAVVDGLMAELAISHPGYYRYQTPSQAQQKIDQELDNLPDSVHLLQLYRILKPLIADIGCLHTGISLSEEMEAAMDDSLKLLPFQIKTDGHEWATVRTCYGPNNPLTTGDHIKSINGTAIQEILDQLKKNIPSDGYNQTLKIQLLNRQFADWYQSILSDRPESIIDIQRGNELLTVKVAHVDRSYFPTMRELMNGDLPQLSYHLHCDSIGVVKIRSFAKTIIKENEQKYDKFLKTSFNDIEKSGVNQLILDLRDNTGGTDGNAVALASRFYDDTFRYWDRIEVTEKIAKQIKGLNRIFYPKPKKRDTSYHWVGALLTGEFDYYHPVKPAKKPYQGQLYILTNGLCMSSCSDLVANLKQHRGTLVLGEETGGGFQGNTSGMMPEAEVVPGIAVTVPLQKYTNAVPRELNVGRGTLPDYDFSNLTNSDDWLDEVINSIQDPK